MLYVVKMDNPEHSKDSGTPTRVRLIGPFASKSDATTWGFSRVHNPYDNPCWQVVDLSSATVEVVAP